MDEGLFESLLHEEESNGLDFKQGQYPFALADDDEKSELLKDILAFCNSWRRSTAYILVGVEEIKGARSIVHGITEHLADNDLQQFVNSKTNKPVVFSYEAFTVQGHQIGVISIPQQERPLFAIRDFGNVKKQAVYVRRGSSTALASPDEIAKMGAAAASDAWAQKELAQQRLEREEHRQFQLRLHADVNRPNVLCDIPIIHTIQYLRVKNYGVQPAKAIRVAVNCDSEFPSLACLRNPISFLVPNEELMYWLYGPQDFDKLPKKLTFKLSYLDIQDRLFEAEQPFDFAYLGEPGGGGRGVDLSRENNHPVVRELRRIADAFGEKQKQRRPPFDER